MENGGQPSRQEGHNAKVLEDLCRWHWGDGRPLSLLDLIELETIGTDLAAWLVSHISRGASLITGAGPGGVGKTTMMRALLGFVPDERHFAALLPGEVSCPDGTLCCAISHELSDHPVPFYLWGDNLRAFFALSEQGHMLAANMHADDLAEARSQIVEANDVPESQFRAVSLFLFMRIEGEDLSAERLDGSTGRRYVHEVHHSQGERAHASVYRYDAGLSAGAPREPAYESACRRFLEEALSRPERTIHEVRTGFLDWLEQHPKEHESR